MINITVNADFLLLGISRSSKLHERIFRQRGISVYICASTGCGLGLQTFTPTVRTHEVVRIPVVSLQNVP